MAANTVHIDITSDEDQLGAHEPVAVASKEGSLDEPVSTGNCQEQHGKNTEQQQADLGAGVVSPDQQGTLISEETRQKYRVWKKNSLQLYDYLQTSAVVWPSLTVQWFPDVEHNRGDKSQAHRLLMGTSTSGAAAESLRLASLAVRPLANLASVERYSADSREFLSTDRDRAAFTKVAPAQAILHRGEVNRARYLPHKPDVLASISSAGDVFVFDRTKHASVVVRAAAADGDDDEAFRPQLLLRYHTAEGFGLSWNVQREGLLLSAALDGHAAVWDLRRLVAAAPAGAGVPPAPAPAAAFEDVHAGGVNDAKWLPLHDSIFGTVGEDRAVRVWDTRRPPTGKAPVAENRGAHRAGVNALSFSPANVFCFATGDTEGTVHVWDARALREPAHTVRDAHRGPVTAAEWSPHEPRVLATGGQDDNAVKVWDMAQAGERREGAPEPPELLFVHGGHMLGVNDLSWNLNEPWMVASVANDNSLHVWRPAATIVERR